MSTFVLHDGPTAAVVCGLDDEVLPDARGGETLRETLAGVMMATSVVTRPGRLAAHARSAARPRSGIQFALFLTINSRPNRLYARIT